MSIGNVALLSADDFCEGIKRFGASAGSPSVESLSAPTDFSDSDAGFAVSDPGFVAGAGLAAGSSAFFAAGGGACAGAVGFGASCDRGTARGALRSNAAAIMEAARAPAERRLMRSRVVIVIRRTSRYEILWSVLCHRHAHATPAAARQHSHCASSSRAPRAAGFQSRVPAGRC